MPAPLDQLPRPPAPPPAPPQRPPDEDAGTQALTEALGSSLKLVRWLLVGMVILFISSGVFIVPPDQVVILLRFGRPVGEGEARLLKPGLHWRFPPPVDELVPIEIGRSHTAVSTAGWYATTPELEAAGQEPPARPSLIPGVDGYALTADGNIIHVRVALKYRVLPASAVEHVFQFTDTTNLVQHLLDNALLHAASRFTADDALYRDTARFKEELLARVTRQVERVGLGITIEPTEIRVSAPLLVRPVFEGVVAAAQDRARRISEARGEAEQMLRKAQGEATAILNEGAAAAAQIVQAAQADARFFNAVLPQYRRDPAGFRQRLLTETLERVLAGAQDKFFLPAASPGAVRELRIQLNREPQKAAPATETKP
jgi:membrane protease subunit HflK